jgi:hypothetical protein
MTRSAGEVIRSFKDFLKETPAKPEQSPSALRRSRGDF